MFKFKILYISVLVLVVFCSGMVMAQDDKLVIELDAWMAAEQESGGTKVLNMAEEIYEKEHPGVDINIVPLPYEKTLDQYVIMSQSNNAPDITLIDVAWLNQLASMGNVKALNQFMGPDVLKEIYPSTRENVTVGKKIMAFPWNPAPNALVYNKSLMKKAGLDPEDPPVNFAELNDAVAKISKLGSGIQGIALNMNLTSFSADYMHPWIWGFGGEIIDENGKIIVEEESMVKTIKWVKNLVDKDYMKPGMNIREIRVLFAQGKVGFMLEGPWIRGILDNLSPKGKEFRKEWGVTPMPVGPGLEKQIGFTQPSSHVMIMSKQTEKPAETYKFMKFLATDPRVTRPWFSNTGLLPVTSSVYDVWPELSKPYTQAFLSQMKYTQKPNGWGPNWGTIGKEYMKTVQEIVYKDRNVKDSLAELAKRLEFTLNE